MSRGVLAAAALSVSLTVLAYAPAMRGPFVWDDLSEIAENPAIRVLWPPWVPRPWDVLRPAWAATWVGKSPERPEYWATFSAPHQRLRPMRPQRRATLSSTPIRSTR